MPCGVRGPALIALMGLVFLGSTTTHPEVQARKDLPLADLLSRLSRVAKLYRDSALRFACDEEITGSALGGKSYRFEYVYAYSPSEGFKDHRIDPTKRSRREVDLNAYRLPQFLRRAYSWAFIFSESAQKRHRYEVLGEDRLFERAAFKLRFEPIPPYQENLNDWFGTAWIDRDTFQILRVEALRADQYEKKKEFESEIGNASTYRLWGRRKNYLIEETSTDFSVEKNGMRFPGAVLIVLSRYVIPGRDETQRYQESTVYRIGQTYTNYQFFTVRTREDIQGIVSGSTGQGSPK